MSPTTRLWRALRSRRLAVVLICALAVYTILATLVPRGAADSAAVVAWATAHPAGEVAARLLGLHHAFASPLFLALVLLLAACTSACATERTSRALKLGRAMRDFSTDASERFARRSGQAFRMGEEVAPQAALAEAADRLGSLGLRVARSESSVEGRSGVFALLGSPVFHWTIVAVMVVVAAGQATRAEGFLGLPLGQRVVDQRRSYLQVTEGPLFGGRYSNLEFVASSLDRHFRVGNVDVGPAPIVTAYRAGEQVASGRVYPNSPLRVGALMVHMVEFGPDVTLSLESTSGAEVNREDFLLDRSGDTSSGTMPQDFSLMTAGSGVPVSARVQVVARPAASPGSAAPAATTVLLQVSGADGRLGAPVALGIGDAVDLPGGDRLRVAEVRDWVRVSVANDWSVPYIYALLGIAIVALAVAVLVPTRRAAVALVERDASWHLLVGSWHSSRDPLFADRVTQAVRDAAEVGGQQ